MSRPNLSPKENTAGWLWWLNKWRPTSWLNVTSSLRDCRKRPESRCRRLQLAARGSDRLTLTTFQKSLPNCYVDEQNHLVILPPSDPIQLTVSQPTIKRAKTTDTQSPDTNHKITQQHSQTDSTKIFLIFLLVSYSYSIHHAYALC